MVLGQTKSHRFRNTRFYPLHCFPTTYILATYIPTPINQTDLLESNRMVGASLVAQMVKNPPAMQETLVQFLGRGDPWRRNRLPTPIFLPGESPRTEEPRGLQPMGSQRVRHDSLTNITNCNMLFSPLSLL